MNAKWSVKMTFEIKRSSSGSNVSMPNSKSPSSRSDGICWKTTPDLHLDLRIAAAVAFNVVEQVQSGGFHLAPMVQPVRRIIPQFGQGVFHVALQVFEAAGVFHTILPASVKSRSLAERSINFSPSSVSRRCIEREIAG